MLTGMGSWIFWVVVQRRLVIDVSGQRTYPTFKSKYVQRNHYALNWLSPKYTIQVFCKRVW